MGVYAYGGTRHRIDGYKIPEIKGDFPHPSVRLVGMSSPSRMLIWAWVHGD